jgi:X-X-X-Leu-X-X-Gly heptad repeat protein
MARGAGTVARGLGRLVAGLAQAATAVAASAAIPAARLGQARQRARRDNGGGACATAGYEHAPEGLIAA